MKVEENCLWWGAAEEKAHLITEAQGIGKKQRTIETQDLEALNGAPSGGAPDYFIGMLLARHRAETAERKVTGAPDEPYQREHDGDTEARQYPDGDHADQSRQG